MPVVELVAVAGHRCKVVTAAHKAGFEGDIRAECICGWKSPRYGAGDRKTLEAGMAAHQATENAAGERPPHIEVVVKAGVRESPWFYDWEGWWR